MECDCVFNDQGLAIICAAHTKGLRDQREKEMASFATRLWEPEQILKRERRYQLLQAAAMLASGNAERYLVNGGHLVAAFVITDAVDLLEEIERRVP